MTKIANKWISIPNAKHIQRVLDLMMSNPIVWESDWASYEAASSIAEIDAMTHCRKTATKLNRKSEWNSAMRAVFAVEYRVHPEIKAGADAFTAATAVAGHSIKELAGSPFYMCRHAMNAKSALVAYDNCAWMLDTNPEDVLALADAGDYAARLLYPACVAFNKSK